jgi:hypothetical protein
VEREAAIVEVSVITTLERCAEAGHWRGTVEKGAKPSSTSLFVNEKKHLI